jgi:hemoglobin
MTRTLLTALAFVATTAFVACGGGAEEQRPPATAEAIAPPPAPPAPEPAPVATAEPEPEPPPPAPKSLFERLGGKDGITKIVDAAVKNVSEDKLIAKYFAKTTKDPKKLDAFKADLVEQVCEATGGPCQYKGKDMKAAHKGMKIKDAEYTAFVDAVTKALDQAGVAKPEQDELVAALGAMKADIVEEQPAKGKTAATGAAKPAAETGGAKK